MNIEPLTIDWVRDLVVRKETTATALAEAFYGKIAAEDEKIGAFLTLSKRRATAKAAEIDQMAERGDPLPPLAGVPVGIKDVLMTRGFAQLPLRRFWTTLLPLTTARQWRGWKPPARSCLAS